MDRKSSDPLRDMIHDKEKEGRILRESISHLKRLILQEDNFELSKKYELKQFNVVTVYFENQSEPGIRVVGQTSKLTCRGESIELPTDNDSVGPALTWLRNIHHVVVGVAKESESTHLIILSTVHSIIKDDNKGDHRIDENRI